MLLLNTEASRFLKVCSIFFVFFEIVFPHQETFRLCISGLAVLGRLCAQ